MNSAYFKPCMWAIIFLVGITVFGICERFLPQSTVSSDQFVASITSTFNALKPLE